MKQILKVEFDKNKNKNYTIYISDDNFYKLMESINEYTVGKKRLFVISKKVYKLYSEKLNLNPDEILILPDGEKEKNFKNYTKILSKAIERNFTRKDVFIAIGGGVIGDIAGFAASTYMRGIDYIQVPTTLLSMVDSSVGGKTAIDMDGEKNVIGTFYQPKAVFINTHFLETLDNRQYKSGIGEILKYSFIEENCGYEKPVFLFEYLTLCADKLLSKDTITVIRIIDCCLKLKIAVVSEDEKEKGLRQVLNFGHTLGHALESITKYKKYTHGEAVVYGMHFILDWAYSKSAISYSYYRMSKELLAKYGFEKSLNINKKYRAENLIKHLKHDKKATNKGITFIVPADKKLVSTYVFTENEVLKMF